MVEGEMYEPIVLVNISTTEKNSDPTEFKHFPMT